MMAKLETKLSQDASGVWILAMHGDIDQENYQFASIIESNIILQRILETQAHKLVIDLSGIERFDSLGLQLLLLIYRQLADHQFRIILRNPSPHLQRILRIMQIDRLFQVEHLNPSACR